MPKSRSSNNLAANSGQSNNGGAGGIGGLAEMLLNRLQSVGPIEVDEPHSDGEPGHVSVEFGSDGENQATIRSDSGHTYQVDYVEDTCTCPHHRFRGARCRHIDATHQALGQVGGQYRNDAAPSGSGLTHNEVNQAIEYQREADRRAENERRDLQTVQEDDGYFYSDHDDEFNAALSRAAYEPLEYDYENALNGSHNTFGFEIEFVGGNPDAIARELYDMGICGYDHQVHYHSQTIGGKWRLERDGSVTDAHGGGELVSPVLTDTPETWRNLKTICEVAQRHGARVNSQCGGHVHMGMNPLDTARQRWKRMFRTIGCFEDSIMRFAGGSLGKIRSGAASYARPFSSIAVQGLRHTGNLETNVDVRNLARRLEPSHNDRYHGINLTNLHSDSGPNTVEFRYFNSSLDPAQLQANVKLANGIMMASEKARIKDHPDDNIFSSEAMKKRGAILREHPVQTNERIANIGIKKLIDVAFTRKKDKDNVLRVYAKNAWRD